jgi:hypothetical protein
MSTVARPRGPMPTRVYWVRRLVLLAVVVLVGWLTIRWIDGGDSGATPPEDETPAAATESDDPTPAGDRDPKKKSKDENRTTRVDTVAETFERPREDCDLTEVLVVPSVAEPAYAEEPVRLSLRISSAGSSPCSLGLDAENLLVVISDGDDTVWDSTHCEDDIPVRDLALQPRWSTLIDLTWSGLHSGRTCASDATPAEPGTYTVQAAMLEGEPSEAEFELVARPKSADDNDDKGKNGDKPDSESDKSDSDSGDPTTSDSTTSDSGTSDSGRDNDTTTDSTTNEPPATDSSSVDPTKPQT